MTPERIQDARRLLGQISAAEWVDLYGRDLVTAIERQAVGAVARGRLAAVAAGGAQLGKSCAEALREFETGLGGGDREAGRKLLTERSGTLKPTQVRMAAAVKLYSAVRLYVLRWAAAGQPEAPVRVTPELPTGKRRLPLQTLLEAVAQVKLPETATAEERERVAEAQKAFRDRLVELGLAEAPAPAPEPAEDPGPAPPPIDPDAN